MRVEIVTPGDGWVLDQMALQLVNHLDDAHVVRRATDAADVVYFCHYNTYYPVNVPCAALFTHQEPAGHPLHRRWYEVAQAVDHCVAMCERYRADLPDEKTSVILPGVDSERFSPRKMRVGVAAQRAHGNDHRKGRDLIERLEREHGDWLEIVRTDGKLDADAMPGWYRALDVYLVASRWEGGPLTVLEANACGVWVVSSDVGFVPEIQNKHRLKMNPPGDYEAMVSELRSLLVRTIPVILWEDWAYSHDALFQHLTGVFVGA